MELKKQHRYIEKETGEIVIITGKNENWGELTYKEIGADFDYGLASFDWFRDKFEPASDYYKHKDKLTI